MATKPKSTVPPVIKVGGSDEESTVPTTKRSEVIHKTVKDATDLYQVLGKIEDTIQELTRMLADTEDSKHMGLRGMPKLTPKQESIKKEIEEARKRHAQVLQMISNK